MNITDTTDTAEQEIIAAINRSILRSEIVSIYDDKCDHSSTTEWIETFCEEVGYANFTNGTRRVWGKFNHYEFNILLTAE